MESKSGPSQFAAANCPGLNTGNTGMDNMPYRRTILSEKLVRGTDFPLKISVRGGGGGGGGGGMGRQNFQDQNCSDSIARSQCTAFCVSLGLVIIFQLLTARTHHLLL